MERLSLAARTGDRAVADVLSTTAEGAPRRVRLFVSGVLAAMVICTMAGVNAWPFSDWELFSRLRLDRQTAWVAVAADAAGRVRSLAAGSLPHGGGSFRAFMVAFAASGAAERNADCVAWLREARREGGGAVRVVRLYRLTWLLSDRAGERAAAAHRSLRWTCSGRGARAAD